METNTFIRIVLKAGICTMLFLGTLHFVSAQTNKTDAQVTKLKAQVDKAETVRQKLEQKLTVADSLMTKGGEQSEAGYGEIKTVNAELKAKDKEYATQRKAIEKQLKSKDKETVAEAKTELKNLDTKYKTFVKESTAKLKVQTKLAVDGDKNYEKGRVMQKENEKAMKQALKDVDTAQKALDKATIPADTEKAKKKKK